MARKNALVIAAAAIAVIIIAVTLGFYASGANTAMIPDGLHSGEKNQNMIEIIIKSDGNWSATINYGQTRSYSIHGFGDRSIPIVCDSGSMYSVVVQKLARSPSTLVVEVIRNGVVSQKSSTSSPISGVISVSGT